MLGYAVAMQAGGEKSEKEEKVGYLWIEGTEQLLIRGSLTGFRQFLCRSDTKHRGQDVDTLVEMVDAWKKLLCIDNANNSFLHWLTFRFEALTSPPQ